jgi:hypothetical protein
MASQYLGLLDPLYNGYTANHLLATVMTNHNHVGIDINSLISAASNTAGSYDRDGGNHPLSLISGRPMHVWVDYDSKQTILNVTIAPCCLSSKPRSRPLLSVRYDLSSVLPTTPVFARFSSSASAIQLDSNSNHYILGWSLKLNGEATALNYSALSLNTIHAAKAKTISILA